MSRFAQIAIETVFGQCDNIETNLPFSFNFFSYNSTYAIARSGERELALAVYEVTDPGTFYSSRLRVQGPPFKRAFALVEVKKSRYEMHFKDRFLQIGYVSDDALRNLKTPVKKSKRNEPGFIELYWALERHLKKQIETKLSMPQKSRLPDRLKV